MILCSACQALYHGPGAIPAAKSGASACEACGADLGPPQGALRRHVVAIVGCVALVVGLGAVGGRSAIVSLVPGAAPIFSAIGLPLASGGLTIEGVHARLSGEGDKALLVVEGDVVNGPGKDSAVPELSVTLNGAGGATLYSWRAHAAKTRLAAGERLKFRTRLESPPRGITEALVKFAPVGDKVALAGDGR